MDIIDVIVHLLLRIASYLPNWLVDPLADLVDALLKEIDLQILPPSTAEINILEIPPKDGDTKILDLPNEIICRIFHLLEPADRYSCYNTCKTLRRVSLAQKFKRIPPFKWRGFSFKHVKPFLAGLSEDETSLVLEFDESSDEWQQATFVRHINLPHLKELELRFCVLEIGLPQSSHLPLKVPPILKFVPKTVEKLHFHNCCTDLPIGNILDYAWRLAKSPHDINLYGAKFPHLGEVLVTFHPAVDPEEFQWWFREIANSENMTIRVSESDEEEGDQPHTRIPVTLEEGMEIFMDFDLKRVRFQSCNVIGAQKVIVELDDAEY
jgi:hypothetical protein